VSTGQQVWGYSGLHTVRRLAVHFAAPGLATAMGLAGRRRAVDHFSWPAIATRTQALYETLK
jgi:starch synthase